MANKFLKALAAVKLVELDDVEQARVDASPDNGIDMEEIDRMVAAEMANDQPAAAPRTRSPAKQAHKSAPAARTTPGATSSEILEGQPLDTLYARARVPEAPYSAEKLLRVLDGLKAMEPAMRKAAVLAMDAADEEWSIADAVLDAQRKVKALADASRGLTQQLATLKSDAEAEKQKREQYLAQATKTVHDKIAELEKTLQDETVAIMAQKAEIEGRVRDAEAACQRELARMDTEVDRLQQIPRTFAVKRTE